MKIELIHKDKWADRAWRALEYIRRRREERRHELEREYTALPWYRTLFLDGPRDLAPFEFPYAYDAEDEIVALYVASKQKNVGLITVSYAHISALESVESDMTTDPI